MSTTKRIIIGSEVNDDRKIELQQVGSLNVVPVAIYDASGTQITDFGGGGSSSSATTPTIANVTMATANTEYSYALPASTLSFRIKLRAQNASFKLAFTSGASGTTYITINASGSYGETGVSLTGKTLYFQSPTASQVAEIISYQ